MKTTITPLLYHPNPLPYYAAQLSQTYSFVLTGGRYTILGWDPIEVITGDHEDPFTYMQERLKDFQSDISPCGGWYGYFGYELGESFHAHIGPRSRDLPLPDLWMGLYDAVVVFDHVEKVGYAVGSGVRRGELDASLASFAPIISRMSLLGECLLRRLIRPYNSPPRNRAYNMGHFHSNFTPESYKTAFDHIQGALRRGDCYQVNLAQRFTADFEGSSWDLFMALMQNNPAPFAAYLQLPESCIISCSPERFIKIDNGIIETKPIKGTCAREEDPEQLKNSEKNRAENLMIVDLMRNDLGKICKTGTVNVTELFSIESYRSVHHLVSTITGQLEDHISPFQALIACFPGGSITGAPKLAAMQQIRALEPHARHVYCGSMGYCDFTGVLDMNITIRTAVVTQGKCHVWAGGGIVLDSSWENEYQECLQKIRPFFNLSV